MADNIVWSPPDEIGPASKEGNIGDLTAVD